MANWAWGDYGLAGLAIGSFFVLFGYLVMRAVGPKGLGVKLVNGLLARFDKIIAVFEKRCKDDADWQKQHDQFAGSHDKKLDDHVEGSNACLSGMARLQTKFYKSDREFKLGLVDMIDAYWTGDRSEDTDRCIQGLRESARKAPPDSDVFRESKA